jgi:hypothetical protein
MLSEQQVPHPGAHVELCLALQLNYTRPGLPTLNPQLLEAWKNEVKEKGHVNCPNDVSWGRRVGDVGEGGLGKRVQVWPFR